MARINFLDDIIDGVGGFLGAVTPLDLFNKEQTKKLSYKFGELMENPGMGKAREFAKELGVGPGAAFTRYGKVGMKPSMESYFQGYKFDRPADAFTPGELAFNRNVRVGGAAALGIYGASSLTMGQESLPAKASGGALQLATHAGITKALYHGTNPMVALAYGGVSAVNMLRKGDNLGPF